LGGIFLARKNRTSEAVDGGEAFFSAGNSNKNCSIPRRVLRRMGLGVAGTLDILLVGCTVDGNLARHPGPKVKDCSFCGADLGD
jgi:hypothetical protein